VILGRVLMLLGDGFFEEFGEGFSDLGGFG